MTTPATFRVLLTPIESQFLGLYEGCDAWCLAHGMAMSRYFAATVAESTGAKVNLVPVSRHVEVSILWENETVWSDADHLGSTNPSIFQPRYQSAFTPEGEMDFVRVSVALAYRDTADEFYRGDGSSVDDLWSYPRKDANFFLYESLSKQII